MKTVIITLLITYLLLSFNMLPAQDTTGYISEKQWGVGMTARVASIPFATEKDRSVSTIIPLIFYEGDYLFFHGIEGGIKFYNSDPWRFSALARVHFFDVPEDYQNIIQGDNLDFGFQARYQPWQWQYLDIELMSDTWGNTHVNFFYQSQLYLGNLGFRPFFQAKLKSADYNSTYFGLNQRHVAGGTELSVGYTANFQIYKNIYLWSAGRLGWLDHNVRNLDYVTDNFTGEFYLGAGFSNDRTQSRKQKLENKPYVRIAHGWASYSDWIPLIMFQIDLDTMNNQMTSVFYGHPLADNIIGLPIHVYLTGGFAWHWASHVQSSAQEVVLGVKFHLPVPWPFRWRLGFVEGISYINRITYIEQEEMDRKNYRASNLLNYLDYTIDIELGQIFGGGFFNELWLGYSIHHRSGIYGTAQQFGRINGGSNYPSIYLQKHF